MENVTFYAKETTGSIGERKPDTTKAETTGSIGYKVFENEPVPDISRAMDSDSLCFKAHDKYDTNSHHSALATTFGIASGVTLAIVGLGYLHKASAAGKITNESFKKFADKLNCVTEPCHKLCSKVKTFGKESYEKIKNFIKNKK